MRIPPGYLPLRYGASSAMVQERLLAMVKQFLPPRGSRKQAHLLNGATKVQPG